ncbi:hypothetical protein BDZ97DRAFT_1938402 [Flammula alnicola]|nr:hypothetical protein BDZ97DRAFT_1938402 [Flammula alnicola]
MSSPKERHYWSQLRAALTAGQWRSSHPAKTPQGGELSWSELFRKFNKHCRGYKDVAEIAAQTQALALLLGARSLTDDDDEDGAYGWDGTTEQESQIGEGDEEEGRKRGKLGLEGECILPEERMDEAMVSYEILKSLQPSNFDTIHLALAYYAYALRNPAECLAHLQKVPDLLQFQNHIPTSAPNSTRSSSAHGLLAPSSYAPSTTSFSGSFSSASVVEICVPEVRDGRALAMAETFRSLCLQGMALELLHPSDPRIALNAYCTALPLFSILHAELSLAPSTTTHHTSKIPYKSSPSKPDLTLFSQLRELWRWVERLLWRAVVLSAKTCDVFIDDEAGVPASSDTTSKTKTAAGSEDTTPTQAPNMPLPSESSSDVTVKQSTSKGTNGATTTNGITTNGVPRKQSQAERSLWTWLAHHTTYSSFWPATFRAKHRSTVCVIHLRAFVLRFGGVLPPSGLPSTSRSASPFDTSNTPSTTHPSTHTNTTTTPSPRSSTSTPPYHPQQKAWCIAALAVVQRYRAILNASTSFPRAGEKNVKVEEFAEICVALWEAGWVCGGDGDGKGAETGAGNSIDEDLGAGWVIDILTWAQTLTFNSSLILRHLTRLFYFSFSPMHIAKRTLRLYIQVVGKAYEASKEGVGEDMDKDARWVETLVFGARMLCSEAGRAWREGGSSSSSAFTHTPTAYPPTNAPRSTPTQGFHTDTTTLDERGEVRPHAHAPPTHDDSSHIEDVLEASSVLEKARLRLDEGDRRLLAEVLLAEGVVWALLGVMGQDPLTRPTHLQKAHTCLLQSLQANPTPSAYYHLALSFARRVPDSSSPSIPNSVNTNNTTPTPTENDQTPPADPFKHVHSLPRALECAGLALEGCPTDVRYWHLLGLLLSAQGEWAGAREVLERGAALDFWGADEGAGDDTEALAIPGTNGAVPDHASIGGRSGTKSVNGTVPASATVNGGSAPPKRRSTITQADANAAYTQSTQSPRAAPMTVLHPSAMYLPPASSLAAYLHPSTPTSTASSGTTTTKLTLSYGLTFDQYPPTPSTLFERHLQLRMTQVALMEVMEGPEGAEEAWLEVFVWVAEKNRERWGGLGEAPGEEKKDAVADPVQAQTQEQAQEQEKMVKKRMYQGLSQNATDATAHLDVSQQEPTAEPLVVPIGITISPATPEIEAQHDRFMAQQEKQKDDTGRVGERAKENGWGNEKDSSVRGKEKLTRIMSSKRQQPKSKRSLSSERSSGGGDTSKSKKVQQMLKDRVDKGRAGISAVSRKIGHGVVRNGSLRRFTSTPDFHAVLQPTLYQASSIHSRRRLSSLIHSSDEHDYPYMRTDTPMPSEPPRSPPMPPSLPPSSHRDFTSSSTTSASGGGGDGHGWRSARENRLLSDMWLMSAATFRRLGKIEQAKGSIQEAEVRDESNPNVWVQLGLYYVALRLYQHAVDTFQKARFIAPDDVAATVHLSRLYLDPQVTSKLQHLSSNTSKNTSPQRPHSSVHSTSSASSHPSSSHATPSHTHHMPTPEIDLAASMLARLTKCRGWDVPEAWYFLAKAYALQGRKERERDALKTALELSEGHGVRDVGLALGWCL